MGTKLKNFSRRQGTKTVVYLLIVLMLAAFAVEGAAVAAAQERGMINADALFIERYQDSAAIWDDTAKLYRRAREAALSAEGAAEPGDEGIAQDPGDQSIAQAGDQGIVQTMGETDGWYYAVRINGETRTNAPDGPIRTAAVFMFDEEDYFDEEGYRAEISWASRQAEIDRAALTMNEILTQYDDVGGGCIVLTDSFLEAKQTEWSRQNRAFLPYIICIVLEIVSFIILLTAAALMAGRRVSSAPVMTGGGEGADGEEGEDPVYLSRVDRIYTEILVLIGFCALVLWFAMMFNAGHVFSNVLYRFSGYGYHENASSAQLSAGSLGSMQILYLILWGIVTAAVAVVCLVSYLSVIRRIKARILFRNTMMAAVFYRLVWKKIWCQWIWKKVFCQGIGRGLLRRLASAGRRGFDFLCSLIDGRRFRRYPFVSGMFYKQIAYMGIQTALILMMLTVALSDSYYMPEMTFILLVGMIVLGAVHARSNNKTFEDITKLCDQIQKVKEGDLLYLPPMETTSPLYESRKLLAKIGNGMQNSVDQAVKSERMKVDLITNVSHDIKTPLTSIISYIDLLSKEEGFSPEARDYVSILSQKSDRLKHIVSDLFDLAKTTSGNLEIHMETLDFKVLIEQTIADMEDRFNRSGYSVRVRLPETAVMIRGDGKKLYRVMQNVLDNALKYSLAGSRIFVELHQTNTKAYAAVKNTAAEEMNFTAAEVMERFSRGDQSRSTEGSGLGLSIAESFTKASGGDFSVSVDGDLFKVVMEFDLLGGGL